MEEMRLREQQKQSHTAQQAALNRELEPSRLGRSLSEALTRRLIILVLTLLMALPAITYSSFDAAHQYGLRQLFWFGRSNCVQIDGQFECPTQQWMSKAGWEEHLRTFISAASAGESEPLTKQVLWIYAPDFNRHGVIGDIKNVTNRETEYAQLWGGLDYMETRYTDLALVPINDRLGKHRTDFLDAYQSLDDADKRKYEIMSAGVYRQNPFDQQNIKRLYGAGLDEADYDRMMESLKECNDTLSQPLSKIAELKGSAITIAADEENFKFIYRHRDYFNTLAFDYDDVSDWLMTAAETTLLAMGVSDDMIKVQL